MVLLTLTLTLTLTPHPIPHLTIPFICASTLTLDIATITDVFQLMLSTLIIDQVQ